MSQELPLFPLRTVLFPGMPLPLRIFEDRYRAMTRELIERGGRFGVLLIKEGSEVGGGAVPHDVGTTAVVEEYEEVDGGRFVLACRGVERFRLLRMLPPRPYPYGEVEIVHETAPRGDLDLERALGHVKQAFPEYFRLALALTDQWARPFALPEDPHRLVNTLGPWLKTEESEKQRLLELIGAAERVEHLARLLQQLASSARADVAERRRQRFGGLGAHN